MNMFLSKSLFRRRERGFSLLETIFACAIMLIGISGVMALFTVAAVKNQSQGDQATRTTEYAQDKMEQLMGLSFGDSTSDTTQYPTATSGGTGLTVGGSVGGTSANKYSDLVDSNGQITTSGVAAYTRQWQVQVDGTGKIKTITVYVVSRRFPPDVAPSTTLISQRTDY